VFRKKRNSYDSDSGRIKHFPLQKDNFLNEIADEEYIDLDSFDSELFPSSGYNGDFLINDSEFDEN